LLHPRFTHPMLAVTSVVVATALGKAAALGLFW
jgi:hypothetical protein